MTQLDPATANPEDGVAAETILQKIVQSGEHGKTIVERAYYAALSEKLAAQLAELRQAASGEGTPPASPD